MDLTELKQRKPLTAQEVKDIRKNLELNFNQFGRYFNVSPVAVQLWEKEKSFPISPISELIRIKSSPQYLEENKEEMLWAKARKPRPKKHRRARYVAFDMCGQ